jgi:anthranilate synthase/aminodeoxychorismate synthase-like glutamine amidotransferase
VILVIDNYDSFTYNLVQYLGAQGAVFEVVLNDALTPEEVVARDPDGIVLSPGPGRPRDAGVSTDVVRSCSGRIPILGVCLGHQCIAEAFGGRIDRAARLMHGKTSEIHHDGTGVFEGLEDPFTATRYHSLIVARAGFPDDALRVTAWTREGEIMGLEHRTHPTFGVQFHPESILTPVGMTLLGSFLGRCRHSVGPVG